MMMNSDTTETRISFSDMEFYVDHQRVDSNILADNQDFSGFHTTCIVSSDHPGIIFCGKLIPTNKTAAESSKKCLARWNSASFCKCSDRDSSLSSKSLGGKKDGCDDDHVLVYRMRKMASLIKSKWLVFMFGSGRLWRKMELSDIRSRQLRKSYHEEEKTTDHGKQWSGLVRVLGCGGGGFNYDELTIANASLAYFPSIYQVQNI